MCELNGFRRIGDIPELHFRAGLLLIVFQADRKQAVDKLDSASMPERRRAAVAGFVPWARPLWPAF